MYSNAVKSRRPSVSEKGSNRSDWTVLSLAVFGVLLNILFVFNDQIAQTTQDVTYKPILIALHAETRQTNQHNNGPIFLSQTYQSR